MCGQTRDTKTDPNRKAPDLGYLKNIARNTHVYIASPYTKGDTAINVRFQLRIWDELFSLGFTPIAPLWTHFQHLCYPRAYSDWTLYDNEIIKRCDVCLRLDVEESQYKQSESSGADAEVELFLSMGKPVFTSIGDLIDWLWLAQFGENEGLK